MKGLLSPAQICLSTLIAALCVVSAPRDGGATLVGTSARDSTRSIATAPATAVYRIKEAAPAADDTGRNERDRDGQAMTPLDQSNDPDDLKVTQEIRKALVADDALSTTAKNIKIITVHGKVILRGPVPTAQEKTKIAKTAQQFTKQPIENQLEVAARH
jgi:osmotically-inducible protein OsmY